MRNILAICAIAILAGVAPPKERHPAPAMPDQFVIGRQTFFDFGPPFNYYEIFFVRPGANGSVVERITLTPGVDVCFRPATIELTSGSLDEKPEALLGTTNPCAIPQKELNRELNRCKHCSSPSGASVSLQVQCGDTMRIVRSNILEGDWFASNPRTPEHTSWAMHLLARLDKALGHGVMDKPMIAMPETEATPVRNDKDSPTLLAVSMGKYDALFAGTADKPSELYRASQIPHATPSVKLESSTPFQPIKFALPDFPAIAKLVRSEGSVTFEMQVDPNGFVADIYFVSGPPVLRGAVQKVVMNGWRFSQEAYNQQIEATINFASNCPTQTK